MLIKLMFLFTFINRAHRLNQTFQIKESIASLRHIRDEVFTFQKCSMDDRMKVRNVFPRSVEMTESFTFFNNHVFSIVCADQPFRERNGFTQ